MTRSPISRVYTGKPGRPKAVAALARSIIAQHVEHSFSLSGAISVLIPFSVRRKISRETAEGVIAMLQKSDLHIIPGPLAREFALLTGEPAPASQSLAPVVGAENNNKKG